MPISFGEIPKYIKQLVDDDVIGLVYKVCGCYLYHVSCFPMSTDYIYTTKLVLH